MNIKKLQFCVFLLLALAAGIYAQTQEATTADGKKVILNSDGTWKYAPTPTPTPAENKAESVLNLSVDEIPTTDIGADKYQGLDDIFNTPAREFTGKVIDVHDGDTLTLLDASNQKYRVRFNGIDAPELKQDFGNRSQQNLAKMIEGKTATIVCPKIDKYRRWVCTVFLEGKDINLEQVKMGFAWHYKKYQDEQIEADRKAYAEAEISARSLKSGLWQQPNATEPSAWRRGENNPNLAGVPKGAILGNTNSMVYHTPGCSSYAKVAPQNRIVFATEKEAIAKGYRLSGQCESTLPVEERPKPNPVTKKRVYEKGSKGGCYYLNEVGKKVYVDKSYCN